MLNRSEPDGVTGESQEEDLLKCQYAPYFDCDISCSLDLQIKTASFVRGQASEVLVRVGLVYDPTQVFIVFHSWRVARDAPFTISFYFIN